MGLPSKTTFTDGSGLLPVQTLTIPITQAWPGSNGNSSYMTSGFMVNGSPAGFHTLESANFNFGGSASLYRSGWNEGDTFTIGPDVYKMYTPGRFSNPNAVAIRNGILYVADTSNNLIRKVDLTTKVVSTLVSTGSDSINGITVDSHGNVFLACSNNHTIDMVTPEGVLSVFAGQTGSSGFADGNGTNASFNIPNSITIDSSDNLYVVDYNNYTIRMITPGADVSTFAGYQGNSGSADGTGTGPSGPTFSSMLDITIDSLGNLYVLDQYGGMVLRKITSGAVVTTLGNLGTYCNGITVDSHNNLYVARSGDYTIVKVSGLRTNIFAGRSGQYGYNELPASGPNARFSSLRKLCIDSSNNIYVIDNSNLIRKITPEALTSTFVGWGSGSNDTPAIENGYIQVFLDDYPYPLVNHMVEAINTRGTANIVAEVFVPPAWQNDYGHTPSIAIYSADAPGGTKNLIFPDLALSTSVDSEPYTHYWSQPNTNSIQYLSGNQRISYISAVDDRGDNFIMQARPDDTLFIPYNTNQYPYPNYGIPLHGTISQTTASTLTGDMIATYYLDPNNIDYFAGTQGTIWLGGSWPNSTHPYVNQLVTVDMCVGRQIYMNGGNNIQNNWTITIGNEIYEFDNDSSVLFGHIPVIIDPSGGFDGEIQTWKNLVTATNSNTTSNVVASVGTNLNGGTAYGVFRIFHADAPGGNKKFGPVGSPGIYVTSNNSNWDYSWNNTNLNIWDCMFGTFPIYYADAGQYYYIHFLVSENNVSQSSYSTAADVRLTLCPIQSPAYAFNNTYGTGPDTTIVAPPGATTAWFSWPYSTNNGSYVLLEHQFPHFFGGQKTPLIAVTASWTSILCSPGDKFTFWYNTTYNNYPSGSVGINFKFDGDN